MCRNKVGTVTLVSNEIFENKILGRDVEWIHVGELIKEWHGVSSIPGRSCFAITCVMNADKTFSMHATFYVSRFVFDSERHTSKLVFCPLAAGPEYKETFCEYLESIA